ncbi:SDR family oxidoreductase [Sphingomonas sp. SORGH_AS_0950]|uniref:SDR family oxidoreductase n=1 Tax=Sphingomonas sp. SORGH_AS_0950 TaxID=3041792 RepID=UPI0027D8D48F|nr:SDR family oxidoreductase [Sphingomonas sp. SORGH_AS_0950]
MDRLATPHLSGTDSSGTQRSVVRHPAFETWAVQNAPAGRIGEPEDIASVVGFLAGPDAGYVNGVKLFVDGGLAQI